MTSHTEKDVAEIASRMTPSQQQALIEGSGYPVTMGFLVRYGMVTLSSFRSPYRRFGALTAYGTAVRNHLISTPDMPKGDG